MRCGGFQIVSYAAEAGGVVGTRGTVLAALVRSILSLVLAGPRRSRLSQRVWVFRGTDQYRNRAIDRSQVCRRRRRIATGLVGLSQVLCTDSRRRNLHRINNDLYNNEKRALRRCKTLRTGCSKAEPKILHCRRPPSRGHGAAKTSG